MWITGIVISVTIIMFSVTWIYRVIQRQSKTQQQSTAKPQQKAKPAGTSKGMIFFLIAGAISIIFFVWRYNVLSWVLGFLFGGIILFLFVGTILFRYRRAKLLAEEGKAEDGKEKRGVISWNFSWGKIAFVACVIALLGYAALGGTIIPEWVKLEWRGRDLEKWPTGETNTLIAVNETKTINVSPFTCSGTISLLYHDASHPNARPYLKIKVEPRVGYVEWYWNGRKRYVGPHDTLWEEKPGRTARETRVGIPLSEFRICPLGDVPITAIVSLEAPEENASFGESPLMMSDVLRDRRAHPTVTLEDSEKRNCDDSEDTDISMRPEILFTVRAGECLRFNGGSHLFFVKVSEEGGVKPNATIRIRGAKGTDYIDFPENGKDIGPEFSILNLGPEDVEIRGLRDDLLGDNPSQTSMRRSS